MGLLIKAGFSRDEALDAAEAAMVEALVNWAGIREPAGWVRKVAIRKAIELVRRHREDNRRAVQGGWLSSSQEDRERIAVVDERSRVVAMLALLPDKQRAVMALRGTRVCRAISQVMAEIVKRKPPANAAAATIHGSPVPPRAGPASLSACVHRIGIDRRDCPLLYETIGHGGR